MEKDWNERFERGHNKSRHWRIIVGVLLIASQVKHYIFPASNEPVPVNFYQQIGFYMGSVGMFALSCWLIYSGFKPKKINIPPD